MRGKMIVEVGFKLNKKFEYYDKLLKDNGLINVFNVQTHDIYYSKINLDNMSEKEIKNSCIRLRSCNNGKYTIQNKLEKNILRNKISKNRLNFFEKRLLKKGYIKVIDTFKKDHHYTKDNLNSSIQLQETKDIGLLLYYDNEKYYGIEETKQRKLLIDELNSYGFNIKYNTKGYDKLRSLYCKEDKFSNNQNTSYN